MPTLTENVLGSTVSISAPLARTVQDWSAEAANYFLLKQGRGWTLMNLHPWGLGAFFDSSLFDEQNQTDVYQTAICNENGQCGTVSISATVGYSLTVPVPVANIGDGLWTITIDVYTSPVALEYHIDVEIGGDVQSDDYSVQFIRDELNHARNDSTYDPTFPMPSTLENTGPVDLTCRDNNGNQTGGNSESYDDDFEYETNYGGWLRWWEEEEAYGGRTPECRPDFSDPAGSGVICTFGN